MSKKEEKKRNSIKYNIQLKSPENFSFYLEILVLVNNAFNLSVFIVSNVSFCNYCCFLIDHKYFVK